MGEKPRVLVGRRVRLRPLMRSDLERRLRWVNDPEVQRMWVGVTTAGNEPEDLRAWFHLVSEDPFSEQWAIEPSDRPGEYAGDVDLHSISEHKGEAWLNLLFGDPWVREREVRRDVLETIARYAFEERGLQTLWAQIPNTDPDTLWAMESIGFEKVEETPLDVFEGVNEFTMRLEKGRLGKER